MVCVSKMKVLDIALLTFTRLQTGMSFMDMIYTPRISLFLNFSAEAVE